MKVLSKRYELTYISDLRYNHNEFAYGFYYDLRDIQTGYNYPSQFIKWRNKRKLIDILRKCGVYCPHRVYRAIG